MPAFTYAALTATETSDFAADRPLVLGTSAMESVSTVSWTAGSGSAGITSTQGHATGFAYTRLFDRFAHVINKPSAAANTAWTLAFSFSTGVSFDSLMIVNHNLSNCSTINLQVSSTNFSGQTIKSFTTGTGRYVTYDLKHTGSVPLRYSGIRFMRFGLNGSAAFQPYIGEIWLGRRRQLSHAPLLKYDPDALASRITVAETFSGVKKQYVQHRGRSILEAAYIMDTSGEYSTLADWFSDCNHGTKSFVWTEKPSSDAATSRIMTLNSPTFVTPHEGNSIRRYIFDMSENAPFKERE